MWFRYSCHLILHLNMVFMWFVSNLRMVLTNFFLPVGIMKCLILKVNVSKQIITPAMMSNG